MPYPSHGVLGTASLLPCPRIAFCKSPAFTPGGKDHWQMQAEPTGRRKQSRDRSISINRSRNLQKKIKGLIHPALAAAEKREDGSVIN